MFADDIVLLADSDEDFVANGTYQLILKKQKY